VGFYLSADERGTAAAALASGREGGGGRLQEKNEKNKK